ncbi:SH3 domain-containing protein [Leptospira sp. 96542]|nr:SH3 domain-containing protein [Leptospira sp. 96542]
MVTDKITLAPEESEIKTLLPRYSEFIVERENPIEYFFQRFGVKKETENLKKDNFGLVLKTAKGKFRSLDFEVTLFIRENKINSTNIRFTFLPSKKRKDIDINYYFKHYGEANFCYEFSSAYSPILNHVPEKWGYFYCGREISFNAINRDIREVCWDVKNKYQVDDCRDTAYFNFVNQREFLPTARNACPHKCYEFIPYIDLGVYIIRKPGVNLRKEPDVSSGIILKLLLNEEVEVIEDTGKIGEIDENVAPWVKIKTKNGFGYVFGAFLKKPKEFWN